MEVNICILWHILHCIEEWNVKPNKKGFVEVELTFDIPLFDAFEVDYSKRIERHNLLTMLQSLLEEGVIVQGKGTLQSFDEQKGDFITLEEKILTTEDFFPEDEEGNIEYTPLFKAENLDIEGCLTFLLEVDTTKAKKKRREHIEHWRKNLWSSLHKKLRPEIQVEKVIKAIFDNLQKYPENNLFLEPIKDNDIYFFATAIFLDFINAIKIRRFSEDIEKEGAYFTVIQVLPKFFEDFKMREDDSLKFDFENLITLEERKKRIYYKSETELQTGENIYEMKRNTFPFFLFATMKKSEEKRVSFEEIENAFREAKKQAGRNMPKDLQNLRGSLKERFGIKGEENFLFEVQNNTVFLQKEIFAF